MDNKKEQILKKLAEMKKELNQKQRRLEKMKRVAHPKAHVRKKIYENGNLGIDSHTDELPGTRSSSNVRSPSSNKRLPSNCVRPPSSNIRSPPSSKIKPLLSTVSTLSSSVKPPSSEVRTPSGNVRLLPINLYTADSQTKCPLIKDIKQSLQLKSDIDINYHNKDYTSGGIMETDQEHNQATEDGNTAIVCVDNSCTHKTETHKHSHGAAVDVKEDPKTQNRCVKSVVDFFVHTSVNPSSEKTVHPSEEAQHFKSKFAIEKSSETLAADKGLDLTVMSTELSPNAVESNNTTAEQNLQTVHKNCVFVDCVGNTDSEEAHRQTSIISLNPHFCSRTKHMSSGNDHLENTLPSSSSFECLMDQFNNKNVLPTLSSKECTLYQQETITDSEFFNALDLTQKDEEGPSQEITENQAPNIEDSKRTLSHIGNSDENTSIKPHKLQKLSNASNVGTTYSLSTSITNCSSQQEVAGCRLQVNSLSVEESENTDCLQSASVNSINSFSDYTELDVIPYSQLELIEDFLSETQNSGESMNKNRHRAKKHAALVKRRSSRLSSYCFTHSKSASLMNLLTHSGSVLCECDCAVAKLKFKQTKPVLEQTKTVAVLSVFQFLIDEAKKTNSSLEFKLPSLYDNLISNRLECTAVSNYFFDTHNYAHGKENNKLETENPEVKNMSGSHRFTQNIGKQGSTVIKGDLKGIEEFTNVDDRNIRDAFRADGMTDTCTDEVLESKLCSHSSDNHDINITLFAANNTSNCTELHGSVHQIFGDRKTALSELNSTRIITLPLEKTPLQGIPLQNSIVQDENIAGKCISVLNRDIVLTKSDIPVTLSDTSAQLKILCPSSQCDTMHLQMTTPKSLWKSLDNDPAFNIHTHIAGVDTAPATVSDLDMSTSEFSASFSNSLVTSAIATTNHLLLQTSSGLSLTSIPETSAAHRTGCDSSWQFFDISFNENGKSNEIDRSLMLEPAERTEFHNSKTPVPQSHLLVGLSKSAFISPRCQVLFPDKSSLSCVQSFVKEGSHKEDGPDMPTNVSSVKTRFSESHNNASHLFVTGTNCVSPWKKLPNATRPVLVLEQNTPGNHYMTPVFSPFTRRSRSKLVHNGRSSQNIFKFSGCIQSCTQDAVVMLLNSHAKTTDQEMKPYIVSVQASSLTVWAESDVNEWTAELDWKLASEIHLMKACLLPRTDSVIAIAASGWSSQSLFASLFLYDWSTGNTARYNIPSLEQQYKLQSASQIELCSDTASELNIAVTSDTHYMIGRVFFNDCLKTIKCLTMSQIHRGKLLSFVVIRGQASASVSLTANQEITVWNMMLGMAVKKIQVQAPLPCLTRLLTATSNKGILLLDTVWRVDGGDCGGVIAVNPLTGYTQKIMTFSVPNNTWRKIESAQSEASFVTAISDKGSLAIWNRSNGALLGYTQSKTTTCVTIATAAKHLIVGDIHGCLHIYST